MSSAYSVLNLSPTAPLVANIPHASSAIPQSARDQFTVSDDELREENRKLTDWFTDELYSPIVERGGTGVQHNVSRFVVDPERFEDDANECMAARGMGVLYHKGCSLQTIRRPLTPEEREALLNEFYRPYHAALTRLTAECLEKFGRCTVIDCHSYPQRALPYEIDGDAARADVVLGTDPHHTPLEWIGQIQALCVRHGYSFALNRPFAGTVLPLQHYRDPRLTGFMLEINRGTYMDEERTLKTAGFTAVQSLVRDIVDTVVLSPIS